MTDNELQMKANEERMNNLFILTGQLVSNAANQNSSPNKFILSQVNVQNNDPNSDQIGKMKLGMSLSYCDH